MVKTFLHWFLLATLALGAIAMAVLAFEMMPDGHRARPLLHRSSSTAAAAAVLAQAKDERALD